MVHDGPSCMSSMSAHLSRRTATQHWHMSRFGLNTTSTLGFAFGCPKIRKQMAQACESRASGFFGDHPVKLKKVQGRLACPSWPWDSSSRHPIIPNNDDIKALPTPAGLPETVSLRSCKSCDRSYVPDAECYKFCALAVVGI